MFDGYDQMVKANPSLWEQPATEFPGNYVDRVREQQAISARQFPDRPMTMLFEGRPIFTKANWCQGQFVKYYNPEKYAAQTVEAAVPGTGASESRSGLYGTRLPVANVSRGPAMQEFAQIDLDTELRRPHGGRSIPMGPVTSPFRPVTAAATTRYQRFGTLKELNSNPYDFFQNSRQR